MQKYLHIKPTFDALVEIKNESFELTSNKITSFLLNSEESNVKINFYPLDNRNKTSIPFCVVANIEKGFVVSKSENCSLINYPNNNLLLEVEPFLLYENTLGEHTKKLTLQEGDVTIFYSRGSTGLVKIENNSDILQFQFSKGINTLDAKASKNTIFIWAENDNKKYSIAIVSKDNNQFELKRLENVDLLEIDSNYIKTFRNLHTAIGHGIVGEYPIKTLVGKYKLVKTENKPTFCSDEKLIPYYFLDAIKVKDFALARSYLSQSLSSNLDDIHLESFFDNFYDFGQNLGENIFPEDVALFYEQNGIKIAKIYHFSIEKGKIADITEV